MNKVKNIIFDYDGTLYNSIKIYAPAFRKAYEYLVSQDLAENRVWTEEEISKWLGYSSKDMWNMFMPNLSSKEKNICSNIIGSSMIQYIKEGKAELYKGAIDVLNELKCKGFNLIFLSNCKAEYMNNHIQYFNLDRYFNDFYCTEQFDFIPKHEIFRFIKEKHKGDYIIVGDRELDIEIGKIHNLYSIGCLYGYGSKEELISANSLVNNIEEIRYIISNL